MGFKTITIKEEVYRELVNTKREDESFSEFFDRLVREKKKTPDLRRFYGAWKISDKEWKKIESALKENRKLADKNYREKIRRLSR